MANSSIVINAVYNNGHSESVSQPGPRFTTGGDLFDCSEGFSPLGVSTVYAIAEISGLSVALTSLQIEPSQFFSLAVQLLLTCAELL